MQKKIDWKGNLEYKPNMVELWSLFCGIFFLGGVGGFVYEELFYRIDLGRWVKRGTTFGPWIPIYGFGAVAIILMVWKWKDKPLMIFLIGSLVAGILEFVTGYLLWHIGHVRLWDYNVEIWNWLNIGGYVCFRSVAFFGVAALIFQLGVWPLLVELVKKIGGRRMLYGTASLAGLFGLDILISTIGHLLMKW